LPFPNVLDNYLIAEELFELLKLRVLRLQINCIYYMLIAKGNMHNARQTPSINFICAFALGENNYQKNEKADNSMIYLMFHNQHQDVQK
jgi:hypothetical protein